MNKKRWVWKPQPKASWSEAEVTTWTFDWHLKCVVGGVEWGQGRGRFVGCVGSDATSDKC